ncbi:MAG: J domain-containing protein [Alphaproteobacteria bacterium]
MQIGLFFTKMECENKDCKKEGIYKAPKNRSLSEYYHFCLKHVREYNKKWNFYAGLEGEAYEDAIDEDKLNSTLRWSKKSNLTDEDLKNLDDPLGLLGKIKKSTSPFVKNSREARALKTMQISYPITFAEVKNQYKKLVKKYHPDMTNQNTEEKFKEINEAFSVLKKYFSKK